MACPHCGLPGACPPGTCLVRDEYNLTGLPRATKASSSQPRKMPAAASKAPAPTKAASPKASQRAAKSYVKREILDLWEEAGRADRTLTVAPVPAGKTGSSLPYYTLRISGTLAEIKATLGKLKTLLRYEAGKTRLEVKLSELTEKNSKKVIPGSWVCYIQVKERA